MRGSVTYWTTQQTWFLSFPNCFIPQEKIQSFLKPKNTKFEIYCFSSSLEEVAINFKYLFEFILNFKKHS